jgi:parvulin-like peptidyl-prolyl isomerase
MSDLRTVLASTAGVSLSLARLLRSLHCRGQLRTLVLDALARQLALDAAHQAGLSCTPAELQAAADRFRQRHNLSNAEQTHAWLAREGLTVADLETGLESDLLIDKFRQHLTEPRLAGTFAASRDRFARARLRQILVASEAAARELLAQLRDQGRDFADLAREHSLDPGSRQLGGSLGLVSRHALPLAIGDALFAARPGTVVGPLASEHGFHLFLVEGLLTPMLDEAAAAVLRQAIFDAWLRDQLRDVRLHLDLLRMD